MAVRRRLATALVLATAISSLGAATTSAATEVGDECDGNEASGLYSLVPEQHASGGTLPLSAPSDGIVTGWTIRSIHSAPVVEQATIFRPTEATGRFQAVAESDPLTIGSGLNNFAARLPVRAGDRFGLVGVGTDSPLFCLTGNVEDHTWSYPGSVEAGSTQQFAAGAFVRVPLVATVEPDVDGDGYGDETQDGCPQRAAYQTACPIVALHVRTVRKRRSLQLLVTADMEAEVTVHGQAMWGFKPKRKGLGKGNLIVPLYGGTKTLVPGRAAVFPIRCSKSVKRRLHRLTPKESVRTRITVTAPNLTGAPTTKTLKPRLHGWKHRRR